MMHLLQLPPKLVFDKSTGEWRRKSYEIGPEPLSPNEDVTLAAMRVALDKPRLLSDAECQMHHRFRSTAEIARYISKRLWRRKKLIYRRIGEAGSDLDMSPVEWDARQALAAFRVQLSKAFRRPPTPELAARARKAEAAVRAAPVVALLEEYAPRGRHRAALIAKRLDLPAGYVRRIIRQSVHDANRQ